MGPVAASLRPLSLARRSNLSMAQILCQYHAITGSWRGLLRDLDAIDSMTAQASEGWGVFVTYECCCDVLGTGRDPMDRTDQSAFLLSYAACQGGGGADLFGGEQVFGVRLQAARRGHGQPRDRCGAKRRVMRNLNCDGCWHPQW